MTAALCSESARSAAPRTPLPPACEPGRAPGATAAGRPLAGGAQQQPTRQQPTQQQPTNCTQQQPMQQQPTQQQPTQPTQQPQQNSSLRSSSSSRLCAHPPMNERRGRGRIERADAEGRRSSELNAAQGRRSSRGARSEAVARWAAPVKGLGDTRCWADFGSGQDVRRQPARLVARESACRLRVVVDLLLARLATPPPTSRAARPRRRGRPSCLSSLSAPSRRAAELPQALCGSAQCVARVLERGSGAAPPAARPRGRSACAVH
jgi:hypothetical protein